MRVHFIDTTILLNILDIPFMNQDRETVLKEYQELKNNRNTFILPLATIIETGNHIAHIDDGNLRRIKGIEFAEMLHKIADDESPWTFLENNEVTREEIALIADRLPESVVKYKSGAGDLSIIAAYEKYRNNTPAIGYIRIWSMDGHLKNYEETLEIPPTRKKRG
jgi:C-terminal processing protease CtpA/Prc